MYSVVLMSKGCWVVALRIRRVPDMAPNIAHMLRGPLSAMGSYSQGPSEPEVEPPKRAALHPALGARLRELRSFSTNHKSPKPFKFCSPNYGPSVETDHLESLYTHCNMCTTRARTSNRTEKEQEGSKKGGKGPNQAPIL